MAMISAALTAPFQDNMKRMFSPAALLTGGGSLAITGTKAGLNAMKATTPPAAASVAAPQAAKAPDRAGITTSNAGAAGPGGALAGNGSTFLTGPTGVAPGSLNLGRNILLGQ